MKTPPYGGVFIYLRRRSDSNPTSRFWNELKLVGGGGAPPPPSAGGVITFPGGAVPGPGPDSPGAKFPPAPGPVAGGINCVGSYCPCGGVI